MYWDKLELPFVYITAELFDGENHQGAKAAASLIRYYHRRHLPILMRFSIEGSTIEREGNFLKRSVARRVAATIKPCNRSCISGVLSDSDDKTESLDELVRGVIPTNQIKKSVVYEFDALVKDEAELLAEKLESFKEIRYLESALNKYNVAPTQLSGYTALQTEWVDGKKKANRKKLVTTYKRWDRKEPLEQTLVKEHPTAPKELIKYFLDTIESYHNDQSDVLFAALRQVKPKSVLIKSLGDLLAKFNELVKVEQTPKAETDEHGLQKLPEPDKYQPGKLKVGAGPYAGSVVDWHRKMGSSYTCTHPETGAHFVVKHGPQTEILSEPIRPIDRHQVHGVKHAVFSDNTPEQTALVHGLVLNPAHRDHQRDDSFSVPQCIGIENMAFAVLRGDAKVNIMGKHINPLTGKAVFVKPGWVKVPGFEDPASEWDDKLSFAKAEQIHHDAARHFWGTGDLYPTVTTIKHPSPSHNPQHYAVSEFLPGEHLARVDYSPEFQEFLTQNQDLIHKQIISDSVMGNTDRHNENMLFDKASKRLHMIDNGIMQNWATGKHALLPDEQWNQRVPPNIGQWFSGLDFSKLNKLLQKRDLPDDFRRIIVHHALDLQRRLKDPRQFVTWQQFIVGNHDPQKEPF
jgi:hypothetical protein